MKKIILVLISIISLFGGNVFAEEFSAKQQRANEGARQERLMQGSNYTKEVIDGTSIYTNKQTSEQTLSIPEGTTKVDTTLSDSYTKSQLEGISTKSSSSSSSSSSNGIEVHVSEDIPGAGCVGSPGDYTCTVQPGFKTVMQLMGGIIKYFTYLAALGGVLFIVINGIMLSMGSMGGNKDEIKKKITMTIGGLILLLLSGLILNAIAPWIYK